jgi:competence protein ComEA
MPRPDPSGPSSAGVRLQSLGLTPAPWVPEQPSDVVAQSPTVGSDEPPARVLPPALADRLPLWLRDIRAAPSIAALAGLAVACAVCVAITAAVLLRHHAQPLSPALPRAWPAAPAVPTPPGIVVDVGGRVRHPGLVTLPAGARVADALRVAGGALRSSDLATVNLAARLVDGQLLLIGVPGAAGVAASVGGGSAPVDLNTATLDQLEALPGVGPVLAQHIIDWREAHHGFRSVSDLQDVPGIGERKYADLHTLVVA